MEETSATHVDDLIKHATYHADKLLKDLAGAACLRADLMSPRELHDYLTDIARSHGQILDVLAEFKQQDEYDNEPHNVVRALIENLSMLATRHRTPEQDQEIQKILVVYQKLAKPKTDPTPSPESDAVAEDSSVVGRKHP
jgi:hypothetical protein